MDEALHDESYRVMKFGGSSLGDPERLSRVVELIVAERASGPLAVVVSAMGDTTDWLLEAMGEAAAGRLDEAESIIDRVGDLATTHALLVGREMHAAAAAGDESGAGVGAELSEFTLMVREFLAPLRQLLLGVSLLRERTPQSEDLVLSFGERLSARIVSRLLELRGLEAVFVDGRDWVETDATFGMARVDWEATREHLRAMAPRWGEAVPVHTGFLGRTPDGRTTTLGRNGSDYTATLLGRALEAREVVVSTDVPGVMTADPAIVSDAYPVPYLSYMEALELANYGARMFHPRTMLPLIESQIPMRIRHTMDPEQPGTVIRAGGAGDAASPTCVTSLERLALVDVRWRELDKQAQIGARVLRALERAEISVWMATQAAHGQAVSVVVPQARCEAASEVVRQELAAELAAGEVEPLAVRAPVTLLSLVAERMNEEEEVAGRYFGTLGAVGVPILAIAQGEASRSISCVIPAADTETAVRTVHAAFNFSHQEINVALLGKGVVGSELIAQIREQRDELRGAHDVQIDVVALADSEHIAFDTAGLDLTEWRERLAAGGPDHLDGNDELLERLRRLPVPVLVDCTAADGMEELYERAFERGVHVVAANKKPLCIDLEERGRLMDAARRHHRAFHYETTVGASLPVIETLKNLVRTGDRVLRIEGALSGTLGYLTNEVMAGVPLSQAVRRARELGYTEPRPQDDLSGLDVARKALILARELGLELDLDDVVVEPLVPADLIATEDLETFFGALEEHDEEFTARVDAMRDDDETLRYLAIVDPTPEPGQPALRVGPVGIPADHPATRLRGSESFVAFTTERYSDYPLIVQGAGAGGAVTAAGVLSDVLRISQSLRGR